MSDAPARKANRPPGTLVPMDFITTPDGILIRRTQEMEPFLARNRELQWADDRNGYAPGRERNWWHVGNIPNLLAEKWLREEGINVFEPNHWPAVKRKLNDLEYLALRVSKGRF